jgi:hypothetical protein
MRINAPELKIQSVDGSPKNFSSTGHTIQTSPHRHQEVQRSGWNASSTL